MPSIADAREVRALPCMALEQLYIKAHSIPQELLNCADHLLIYVCVVSVVCAMRSCAAYLFRILSCDRAVAQYYCINVSIHSVCVDLMCLSIAWNSMILPLYTVYNATPPQSISALTVVYSDQIVCDIRIAHIYALFYGGLVVGLVYTCR